MPGQEDLHREAFGRRWFGIPKTMFLRTQYGGAHESTRGTLCGGCFARARALVRWWHLRARILLLRIMCCTDLLGEHRSWLFTVLHPGHPYITQVRRRHLELCMALLRIMRRVDLLEGRFAAVCGCAQPGQCAAAAELSRELAKLEAAVAPQAPGAAPPASSAAPPYPSP